MLILDKKTKQHKQEYAASLREELKKEIDNLETALDHIENLISDLDELAFTFFPSLCGICGNTHNDIMSNYIDDKDSFVISLYNLVDLADLIRAGVGLAIVKETGEVDLP